MVARGDRPAVAGEFPDDPMMWVSHETIYQSLFVQGRGELRRELHRCLRTGRAHRRPRGRARDTEAGSRHGHNQRTARRGRRPGRARPLGRRPDHRRGNRSAVGTLVERTTRYVLLLHLPDGHDADQVNQAMKAGHRDPARRAVPHHHLGPGQGDGPPRRTSPSTPASRSTSATRTAPGSGDPTRTPTACSANTCPKAPTSPCTAPRTSPHRPQPQQPSPRDPRIYETIRETRPASCADRLNPPDRARGSEGRLRSRSRSVHRSIVRWTAARRR